MKVSLFDFQEDALGQLHARLVQARDWASIDTPQAISFSAPTGSGKTIVMTALFEDIFFGDADLAAQSDAVILWISDMPELNEQTRLKIEGKSDRIRVRQLVTIDSDFDAERLVGGHIYFVNTQKLGSDKLLTRQGDGRQYTIWETLTNTAKTSPERFYVVIDEAHRGMRSGRVAQTAQTIMQRFLLGSPEDGLCSMPLVIGISATPRRFEDILAGTPHSVHKVHIPPERVRESGLLKDRILIHYPEEAGQAEMTLLAAAATRWQIMSKLWKAYCAGENLPAIRPILVIQVEDGSANIPTRTKTDLATALATIESAIGRSLDENEIAHAFTEGNEIKIHTRSIRHIEASRIADDAKVRVVLFKMSLSTGWDCPQAEVMMSFRRAQDHTYIAQLLGRMVRTPLARQVERDAALNDVHLYVPYYDENAVRQVIEDLRNVEDVPPATVGASRELITLQRRRGTGNIFAAMQNLITYRVNAVRSQSSLRRLVGLGRALTHDAINNDVQHRVVEQIVEKMADEIQRLQRSTGFSDTVKQIIDVDLKTLTLQGIQIAESGVPYTLDAASADIERHFERAGRVLGNGLHIAYWKHHERMESVDAKVSIIILVQDREAMQNLERYAEEEFNRLYEAHWPRLASLKEQRRKHYDKLRLATAQPQTIAWHLPDSINFRRSINANVFEKHLYIEDNGTFRADLGTWEREVLEEELRDSSVVAWLRNVDRQPWSLEIPYRQAGAVKPMFPDLIIIREDSNGYHFDILEPHDASRDDNVFKAVGLAEFAEKHWDLFGRIQLIRKQRAAGGQEYYNRLDMSKMSTRRKALGMTSNGQLDQLFQAEATDKFGQ